MPEVGSCARLNHRLTSVVTAFSPLVWRLVAIGAAHIRGVDKSGWPFPAFMWPRPLREWVAPNANPGFYRLLRYLMVA